MYCTLNPKIGILAYIAWEKQNCFCVMIKFSNIYTYDQILGARDGDSSNTKVNKVNSIIICILS